MKKLIYSLFIVIICCGTLGAQEIFNTNGGFEDSPANIMYTETTTEIAGWLLEIQSGAMSFMVSDAEAAVYAGAHGLMVNVTELGSDSYSLQAVGDSLHLEEEEFYRATLMVKSMVTDSAHMAFTVGRYDPFSEYARLGSNSEGPYRLAPFNEWRKLTVTFMAVVDLIRVPIHFQELGITYIDELKVIQSEIAGATIDESGDSILIDLGINISEIPAEFDLSTIQVKSNGTLRPLESLEIDRKSYWPLRNGLKGKLSSRVGEGSTVTVTYARPTTNRLEYDDARVDANYPNKRVPKFTNLSVENLSTAVGVEEFQSDPNLVWYLNDSRDLLTVAGLEDAASINIYSITGQLLKTIRVNSSKQVVGVSDLPGGIYVMSVKYSDDSGANTKFLK